MTENRQIELAKRRERRSFLVKDQDDIVEDAIFLIDTGEWPGNLPKRLRHNPNLEDLGWLLRRAGAESYAKIVTSNQYTK